MRNCELKEVYCGLFGSPARPPEVYFAPGRVNLIGEHIDYNGGLVMPAAISLGIRAAVSARSDNVVEMRSLNEEGAVRVVLDKEILFSERDGWGNYPKGVLKHLSDQGARLGGMNILFSGDLPVGAGLSSSAAIEVLTGYIILDQFGGEQVDGTRLALTCKEAENEFIGVNCGIMDQFTSAMGKEGRAILLDCATLDFEYLPVELGEFSLVIMNSNKKRALSESRYNERRSECDAALKLIASERKIENLCDARPCDVEELISDPVLRKRALHAVTENSRVKKAASALRGNDVAGFARLLVESHESLRDNYEVTGFELDALVESALASEACIGARMTGAGFGGCAIAVARRNALEEFKKWTRKSYVEKTGLMPEFYECKIADGVKKLVR